MDENSTTDNPARRLLNILAKAVALRAPPRVGDGWSHIFGVGPRSGEFMPTAVYRWVIQLDCLICQVIANVEATPGIRNKELYLRSLKKIAAIPQISMGDPWKSVHLILTPDVIADLEHCADRLDDFSTVDSPDVEEVESIARDANILFEEVRDSSIDGRLKVILLDLLESVRRACAEFEIRGTESLAAIVELAIGKLLRLKEELRENDKEPLLKRVVDLVKKVDDVASRAMRYKPLLKAASRLLIDDYTAGPGPAGSP